MKNIYKISKITGSITCIKYFISDIINSVVQTTDGAVMSTGLKIYRTFPRIIQLHVCRKVQVGKDQEKAQSEKDSNSKNRGGKKPN